MTRVALLAVAYLFFLYPLSSIHGQDAAFDLRKVVKDISAKCDGAKQYAFEGELQLAGQQGSAQARILASAKVKLAVSQPGKYLLQIDAVDKGEYLLISDGQKTSAYVPKLKQYTEQESASLTDDADDEDSDGASSDDEHDLAETFARMVVPLLGRMQKTAEVSDSMPVSEVKYEGKKQKWPVIRVISRADEKDGRARTEITVDPATLRIGRLVWLNLRSSSNGEKVLLQLTMSFNRFQVGETLPESTFIFEPPNKAKLVETVPIPGQTGSALLNHAAPDFDLKTLEGERIHLSDLRGHPVLLSFWASWCGLCRKELPHLSKIYQAYKDSGLTIFGVNDEGKSVARDFVSKNNLPFATLDDSGLKAHRLYRVRSIPSVFLIDAGGKVVRYFRGAHDEESFRAALKSVGL